MTRPTLTICHTCKGQNKSEEGGKELFQHLKKHLDPSLCHVTSTACLAHCGGGCCFALQQKNKYSYIYGHIPSDMSAKDMNNFIGLYGKEPKGLVAFKQRPASLKDKMIARIPPLNHKKTS